MVNRATGLRLVLVQAPVLVLLVVLGLVPVLVLALVLLQLALLLVFPVSKAAPPVPPSPPRVQFAFLLLARGLGLISLSHKSLFSFLEEPVSL